MTAILGDPRIGGFEVTTVLDKPHYEIMQSLGEFLAERKPRDTILFYLSGHGVLSKRGDLFFAARDTNLSRLSYTAVDAAWLRDRLDECDAARQILILDCCHGGSFPGAKAGTDLELERRLVGGGRGRDLLASSRASELSYEHVHADKLNLVRSVFTAALVSGIRNGAADADNDGLITVEDAFNHAEEMLRAAGAVQNPQYSRNRTEGKLYLALNPHGIRVTPARFSEDLRSALGSGYRELRLGGVRVLGGLLTSKNSDEALIARVQLQEVVSMDQDWEVAGTARSFLDTSEPADSTTAYPNAEPVQAGAIHGVGITVIVTDLARSISFYRDRLGFYEVDVGANSSVLVSGDTRLILRVTPSPSAETERLIYLNLEVGDIETAYLELVSKGVRFVHGPRPVNRGERLELWSATFLDPDDHHIAISQWRALR